jgi:hypothetical protein
MTENEIAWHGINFFIMIRYCCNTDCLRMREFPTEPQPGDENQGQATLFLPIS